MTIAQPLNQFALEHEEFDIAHDYFKLENGLQVIVVEDHSVPLVKISVQYNVGSKDEPKGLKGFAHLFEHLMFCGTQNHPGSYITNLIEAGATDLNGYTTRDKTFYYQTVPTTSVDYALFAESERMGYFTESLTQDMLDQQIGIVLNEKDERENQPFGKLFQYLNQALLPYGHPYRHPVIGYRDDISNANLNKALAWFKKFYRPNNAILTLSGDIDVKTAQAKVEQYFAHIESGPQPEQQVQGKVSINSTMTGTYYDKMHDPMLYLVWQLPDLTHEHTRILSNTLSLLGGKKTSFLNRIWVDEQKLVKDIRLNLDSGRLCSQLYLSITPVAGVSLQDIQEHVFELIDVFIEEEITQNTIEDLKLSKKNERVFAFEDINYRTNLLLESLAHYGNTSAFKENIKFIDEVDVEQVKKVFQSYLTDDAGIFKVLPHEMVKPFSRQQQRKIPKPLPDPLIKSPEIQHFQLKSGLDVYYVQKEKSGTVKLILDLGFGCLSEQKEQAGWVDFINELKLNSDQGEYARLDFKKQLNLLGTSFSLSSNNHWSSASFYSSLQNFEAVLKLFSDFIFKTQFSESLFKDQQKNCIDDLSRNFANIGEFESYVYPALIYPKNHPLRKHTDRGRVDTIEQLSLNEIVHFHETHLLSKITRLIIVGDHYETRIAPLLEQYFGHVKPFDYDEPVLPVAEQYNQSEVYLIEDLSVNQDHISVSTMLSDQLDIHDPAYSIFKDSLSHTFNSRINLNLREQKTWTYGVQGFGGTQKNVVNYGISLGVEQAYTLDAIQQIVIELDKVTDSKPLTEREHQLAVKTLNLSLIPILKTHHSVADHVLWLLRKQYPQHWLEEKQKKYQSQTMTETLSFVQRYIAQQHWIWVIRGNVRKLIPELEKINLGDIHLLEVKREGYYD